jgi:predicted O-methyltransferase YrrM
MTASDKAFTGAIPQLYDRLLVPMIFAPYARDLAQRITAHSPRDVLETAAGTGAVTAALASALPADTRITATDLNEPMLAQARTHLADDPRLRWPMRWRCRSRMRASMPSSASSARCSFPTR